VGAHPLFSTLSRWGLNQIKLAYSSSQPDWVSMPAVLVQGLLLRRTRRFFPGDGRNHWQYSFCLPAEGWPGWVGLGGWSHTKMVYPFLQTVTHPSTNWARRWLTSLMRPTTLPTKPNCHLTDWQTFTKAAAEKLNCKHKLVAADKWCFAAGIYIQTDTSFSKHEERHYKMNAVWPIETFSAA